MDVQIILTLVAFLFVAITMVTGKLPASIACGVAVLFLWITGVLSTEEAFANFVSNNSIVMVGMMVEIGALMKTNALRNVANQIRRAEGSGFRLLLIASMIIPYFLCQFIGGITAMITMVPILIALAKEINVAPTKLILPASVGAQAGLYALPIGGGISMYLIKNQMMANLGCMEELGFFDLCMTRLPANIVVILFVVFIGHKLLPERDMKDEGMLDQKTSIMNESTLAKWQQIATYIILIGSVVMMCFTKQLGITNTQIAMGGAFLVVILGILDEREMFQSVNWSLVFLMAFMLAIATAIGNSGAGDLIANRLAAVFESGNTALAVTAVFIVSILMTQFMDNVIVINMITPIVIIACMQYNMSALPFICAIDASGTASFSTPLSSPTSLIAYKMGGYSIWEMLKFTMTLLVITTIVSVIWIPLYFSL
ncbi:MAG: anion permease [Clostridiales bacterium]|nr:anion permease [Clostridiales bacterium]